MSFDDNIIIRLARNDLPVLAELLNKPVPARARYANARANFLRMIDQEIQNIEQKRKNVLADYGMTPEGKTFGLADLLKVQTEIEEKLDELRDFNGVEEKDYPARNLEIDKAEKKLKKTERAIAKEFAYARENLPKAQEDLIAYYKTDAVFSLSSRNENDLYTIFGTLKALRKIKDPLDGKRQAVLADAILALRTCI